MYFVSGPEAPLASQSPDIRTKNLCQAWFYSAKIEYAPIACAEKLYIFLLLSGPDNKGQIYGTDKEIDFVFGVINARSAPRHFAIQGV